MHTVVLCHAQQSTYLESILSSVSTHNLGSLCVVYHGAESYSKQVKDMCAKFGAHFTCSDAPHTGFYAGYNRDIGRRVLVELTNMEDDCLFIDGDCVPSKDLVQHHVDVLAYGEKVIGCGIRMNKSTLGDVKPDRRLGHPANQGRLFVRGVDRLLRNQKEIAAHSVAWSCNMSLTRKCITEIIKANQATGSAPDRLFHSHFDGSWGGEDTLVGLFGFRLNADMVLMDPSRSFVTHHDHPVSEHQSDNLRKCFGLEQQAKVKLPSTCTLTVNAPHGICVDTREFYAGLVCLERSDPKILGFAQELGVVDAYEIMALHSLFSANPSYKTTTQQSASTLKPGRVLELFNIARSYLSILR